MSKDTRGPWQVRIEDSSDQLWGDDETELLMNIRYAFFLTDDEWEDAGQAVREAFKHGSSNIAGWKIREIEDTRPEEDPYDY